MYGFAFNDPAHLINFNIHSLRNLLNKIGFSIIDSGYISTPRESFNYDYQSSHSNENIYCLSKKVIRNTVQKDRKFRLDALNKNKIILLLRLSFCNIRYHLKVLENITINFLKLFIRIIKSLIKLFLSIFSNILLLLKNF